MNDFSQKVSEYLRNDFKIIDKYEITLNFYKI